VAADHAGQPLLGLVRIDSSMKSRAGRVCGRNPAAADICNRARRRRGGRRRSRTPRRDSSTTPEVLVGGPTTGHRQYGSPPDPGSPSRLCLPIPPLTGSVRTPPMIPVKLTVRSR
jgi:hypothetical protein